MSPSTVSTIDVHARHRRARFFFRIVFVPMLALYLAMATPLLGNFVVLAVVDDAIDACGRTVEGMPQGACMLGGRDVTPLWTGYTFGLIFAGVFNPILAIVAIWTLIPAAVLVPWLIAIAATWAWQYWTRQAFTTQPR